MGSGSCATLWINCRTLAGSHMSNVRVIARLDIKAPNLIKGVHLEGLRKIGDPGSFARRYYEAGIDELLYMDCVASLYERNSLADIVESTSREVFIPMTVGGGIRSIDDASRLLGSGADKVAINTAAVRRPQLISEIAAKFGSQCMVLSIEAKRSGPDTWEAYTDNGREHTGLNVTEWATRAADLGAGEILLTSVDMEGTRKGYDIALTSQVSKAVPIPVIASGGLGTVQHFIEVIEEGHADAVAMADALHYNRIALQAFQQSAMDAGIDVRQSVGVGAA